MEKEAQRPYLWGKVHSDTQIGDQDFRNNGRKPIWRGTETESGRKNSQELSTCNHDLTLGHLAVREDSATAYSWMVLKYYKKERKLTHQ